VSRAPASSSSSFVVVVMVFVIFVVVQVVLVLVVKKLIKISISNLKTYFKRKDPRRGLPLSLLIAVVVALVVVVVDRDGGSHGTVGRINRQLKCLELT
jgi:hypothetical protein